MKNSNHHPVTDALGRLNQETVLACMSEEGSRHVAPAPKNLYRRVAVAAACLTLAATVGLTAGVTGSLSIPAQYLIILYMYFGRVGVLTISLGFLAGNRAEERFRYAETKLLIG